MNAQLKGPSDWRCRACLLKRQLPPILLRNLLLRPLFFQSKPQTRSTLAVSHTPLVAQCWCQVRPRRPGSSSFQRYLNQANNFLSMHKAKSSSDNVQGPNISIYNAFFSGKFLLSRRLYLSEHSFSEESGYNRCLEGEHLWHHQVRNICFRQSGLQWGSRLHCSRMYSANNDLFLIHVSR